MFTITNKQTNVTNMVSYNVQEVSLLWGEFVGLWGLFDEFAEWISVLRVSYINSKLCRQNVITYLYGTLTITVAHCATCSDGHSLCTIMYGYLWIIHCSWTVDPYFGLTVSKSYREKQKISLQKCNILMNDLPGISYIMPVPQPGQLLSSIYITTKSSLDLAGFRDYNAYCIIYEVHRTSQTRPNINNWQAGGDKIQLA